MLKIWGRLSSINVRKVVLAAQWLAVPFERIEKSVAATEPLMALLDAHLQCWFRGILAHPASRGVLQLSPS